MLSVVYVRHMEGKSCLDSGYRMVMYLSLLEMLVMLLVSYELGTAVLT